MKRLGQAGFSGGGAGTPDGSTAGASAFTRSIGGGHVHCKPDTGAEQDASEIGECDSRLRRQQPFQITVSSSHITVTGKNRTPFNADSAVAKLDPGSHLRPNRHGEWCGAQALVYAAQEAGDGPQWGVALMPPGTDEPHDPRLAAAMSRQHGR